MNNNKKLLDNTMHDLIALEESRQNNTINLIASENICPQEIRDIQGSILTNKYAEGVPGRRFYGGCEIIDQIEELAQQRCCQLFNAEYANVQPHAGAQANLAALFALVEPGRTILSMDFSCGGHLTHGHPMNIASQLWKFVHYGVNRQSEYIDFDEVREQALKHKPSLIIAGASSYSRIIDYKQFKEIASEVGALLLADIAHIAGLIAVGLHPHPFPYADIVTSTTHKTLRGARGGFIMAKKEFAQKINRAVMPGVQGGPLMANIAAKATTFLYAMQPEFKIYQKKVIDNTNLMAQYFMDHGIKVISGGTDTHLFVCDVSKYGKTGKEIEIALSKENIILNRNAIPYDTKSPLEASGIRIGTPWITSKNIIQDELIKVCKEIVNTILL